jgi:hypothetical protein
MIQIKVIRLKEFTIFCVKMSSMIVHHYKANLDKAVSLKVSLLAWRNMYKWIPTKNNLHRRGVFHSFSLMCSGGCVKKKSINQLFSESNFF